MIKSNIYALYYSSAWTPCPAVFVYTVKVILVGIISASETLCTYIFQPRAFSEKDEMCPMDSRTDTAHATKLFLVRVIVIDIHVD